MSVAHSVAILAQSGFQACATETSSMSSGSERLNPDKLNDAEEFWMDAFEEDASAAVVKAEVGEKYAGPELVEHHPLVAPRLQPIKDEGCCAAAGGASPLVAPRLQPIKIKTEEATQGQKYSSVRDPSLHLILPRVHKLVQSLQSDGSQFGVEEACLSHSTVAVATDVDLTLLPKDEIPELSLFQAFPNGPLFQHLWALLTQSVA